MKKVILILLVYLYCNAVIFSQTPKLPVKIWMEKITIPTYQVDTPDPNPRFYDGRATQGSQGHVYPYPMSDMLLGKKEQDTYEVVYMENDYIKISVLPELGGRIFSALDKTNNYDFFLPPACH